MFAQVGAERQTNTHTHTHTLFVKQFQGTRRTPTAGRKSCEIKSSGQEIAVMV